MILQGDLQALGLRKETHPGGVRLLESQLARASFCFSACFLLFLTSHFGKQPPMASEFTCDMSSHMKSLTSGVSVAIPHARGRLMVPPWVGCPSLAQEARPGRPGRGRQTWLRAPPSVTRGLRTGLRKKRKPSFLTGLHIFLKLQFEKHRVAFQQKLGLTPG